MTAYPMRKSLALGFDIPDGGYTLTNYTRTQGREGPGTIMTVRRGGSRGAVVGEIADFGDGGGAWPRVSRQETAFFEWLAQVPDVFDPTAPINPNRSEEIGATTLLLEQDALRELKKIAAKDKTPIARGVKPWMWEGELFTLPFDQTMATIRKRIPEGELYLWSAVDGWVEVPA